ENTKTISSVKKKTDEKIKETEEEKEQSEEVVPVVEKEEPEEKVTETPEKETKEEEKEKKETKEEVSSDSEEEEEEEDQLIKRTNKVIWILTGIFTVAVIAVVSFFLIVPYFTKTPDVEIPKVAEMTVIEAEKVLKKAGFEVAIETMKEESDIEEGLVTRTSPAAGRTVKKGTVITIYESTGEMVYEVEDYKGRDYLEVKTELEKIYGLKVHNEERESDDSEEYTSQQIIGQNVEPGTTLTKGEEITLYTPKADEGLFPDMVEEEWTVDDVQAFCDKYGVLLTVEPVITTEYPEGKVLSQSRSPKTQAIKGSRFKITVAKAPTATPTPTPSATP
ncbi:MAG: PASTA domain-containing protein, partial [Bacilli bacterium]|nr:PASTA domain-containing protein [Bacilli bacterium]